MIKQNLNSFLDATSCLQKKAFFYKVYRFQFKGIFGLIFSYFFFSNLFNIYFFAKYVMKKKHRKFLQFQSLILKYIVDRTAGC